MEFTFANLTLLSLLESVLASYFLPHATTTFTSFFLISALFDLLLFALYKLVLYPFFRSPLRHLPQARGFLPLVGHALRLFQRPGGEPHLRMMKETNNDGLILTRGFFHRDRLIVTSPAAIADVLVHKS